MKWNCDYCDSKGRRCEAQATQRLQFSLDHPFDYVQVCDAHAKEYKFVAWVQNLKEEKENAKDV